MPEVLVVGGAGYVGSVLVGDLVSRGSSVRVVDRLFFGVKPLEEMLDRIELIQMDMRELDESDLRGVTAVVNIAGLSNDPMAETYPEANDQLNAREAVRLAEVAKAAGVSRYILASSCALYDKGIDAVASDADILLDETSEVAPVGVYATGKLKAELGILPLADDSFSPVVLRKGTIYGFSPRMRFDLVVNTFLQAALTSGRLTLHHGGTMWRPLIDVTDVARGYVTALEADPELVSGQIFNLSGENLRVLDVAASVQRVLASRGVEIDVDVEYSDRLLRSYRVSTEKMRRVLGFQASTTVEASIERMLDEIGQRGLSDFSHPRYYNIEWMKLLHEAAGIVEPYGYVLTQPAPNAARAALGG